MEEQIIELGFEKCGEGHYVIRLDIGHLDFHYKKTKKSIGTIYMGFAEHTVQNIEHLSKITKLYFALPRCMEYGIIDID